MDDTYTNAPSPSSTGDAESVVTTATTPRAKFPSDLKTLACTWPGCPKTFNRPARLRDHLNSHTNSRPFKCPYPDCDKDYIEDKYGYIENPSYNRLRAWVWEAWDAVLEAWLMELLASMPQRCEAVIKANGMHTKY